MTDDRLPRRVTPEQARAEGLVCCPNPFCWNGRIPLADNALCGVCKGRGVDPVDWLVVYRERVCDICGEPLTRGPGATYTHASGADPHEPVPVRQQGVRQPAIERPSYGHKRPSGAAALFTKGDGR